MSVQGLWTNFCQLTMLKRKRRLKDGGATQSSPVLGQTCTPAHQIRNQPFSCSSFPALSSSASFGQSTASQSSTPLCWSVTRTQSLRWNCVCFVSFQPNLFSKLLHVPKYTTILGGNVQFDADVQSLHGFVLTGSWAHYAATFFETAWYLFQYCVETVLRAKWNWPHNKNRKCHQHDWNGMQYKKISVFGCGTSLFFIIPIRNRIIFVDWLTAQSLQNVTLPQSMFHNINNVLPDLWVWYNCLLHPNKLQGKEDLPFQSYPQVLMKDCKIRLKVYFMYFKVNLTATFRHIRYILNFVHT